MDEDRLNISVRKFLKEVGVTSQREIEKAARDAAPGAAAGGAVDAVMTLEIPSLGLTHVVRGRIELG